MMFTDELEIRYKYIININKMIASLVASEHATRMCFHWNFMICWSFCCMCGTLYSVRKSIFSTPKHIPFTRVLCCANPWDQDMQIFGP